MPATRNSTPDLTAIWSALFQRTAPDKRFELCRQMADMALRSAGVVRGERAAADMARDLAEVFADRADRVAA